MAPPRCTALLLLVSLFLLSCISHAAQEAARPGSGQQPLQEQHGEVEDLVAASFAEVEEQCGGAAGGEEGGECLMRTTLMAHTDYYYYGNHN